MNRHKHTWKCVGITSASDGDYLQWCSKCGAVGYTADPVALHPKSVYIVHEVTGEKGNG